LSRRNRISIDAFPVFSEQNPGIAVSRRSPLTALPVRVCDPLKALPPKDHSEPLVHPRVGGRQRIFCWTLSFLMRERLVRLLPAMISEAERTRDRSLAAGTDATILIGQEMMRTTFDIIAETVMLPPGGSDVVRIERGTTCDLKPTGWISALSIFNAVD